MKTLPDLQRDEAYTGTSPGKKNEVVIPRNRLLTSLYRFPGYKNARDAEVSDGLAVTSYLPKLIATSMSADTLPSVRESSASSLADSLSI